MPPAARVPSPQLVYFLRRAIRAPLSFPRTPSCALRTTTRPLHYPSPCTDLRTPPQCRFLHLYKTARARTTLGMHKILSFTPYQVTHPSESEHKINMWTKPGGTLIAEGLSLVEVLDEYVKPGHMLYLTQHLKKGRAENYKGLRESNAQNEFNNYAIVEAGTKPVPIAKHKKRDSPNAMIRDMAGLKEIHIMLSSPPDFWQIVLNRAYAFLERGHPVEWAIRTTGAMLPKEERRKPKDPDIWPWYHTNFPHLRPDVILKAMPEGTYFMITPLSDGRHVQWVFAPPNIALNGLQNRQFTKRLFKIKAAVKASVKEGKASQLPKVMRKELISSGHNAYSLDTGTAKHAVEEGRIVDHIRWGEESFDEITSRERKQKRAEQVALKARQKALEKTLKMGARPRPGEPRPMRVSYEKALKFDRQVHGLVQDSSSGPASSPISHRPFLTSSQETSQSREPSERAPSQSQETSERAPSQSRDPSVSQWLQENSTSNRHKPPQPGMNTSSDRWMVQSTREKRKEEYKRRARQREAGEIVDPRFVGNSSLFLRDRLREDRLERAERARQREAGEIEYTTPSNISSRSSRDHGRKNRPQWHRGRH